MIEKVIYQDKLYAIFGNTKIISIGTTFLGEPEEKLQFSVLKYNKGKILQNHIHKYRPRIIERTQECWVVLQGSVKVFVYSENKVLLHTDIIIAGQFFISYRGGHGYEIIEDETIVVESKLGDFIGVEQDKEKF